MNHGVVTPGAFPLGWPEKKEGTVAPYWPLSSLKDALLKHYDNDAWFQPVTLDRPGSQQPRINIQALLHEDVYLSAIFLDYDLPDHRAWRDEEEEKAECKVLLAKAMSLGLPRPGVYSTAHGARLAWPLAEKIHGRFGDSFVSQFHAHCRSIGLETPTLPLDPKAQGWNRCFRLPYGVRDGKTSVPSFFSVRRMEPLDWRPASLEEVIPTLKSTVSGDAPEYRELTEAEWLKIPSKYRADLRAKKPLLQPGNRNEGAFGKGSILSQLSLNMSDYMVPDPELLYLAIFDSVVACYDNDEEPSLERVWETLLEFTDADADMASLNAEFELTPAAAATKALEAMVNDPDADPEALLKAAEKADRMQRRAEAKKMADKNKANREAAIVAGQENASYPHVVYAGDARHVYMLFADNTYHQTPKDTLVTMLEREHGSDLRTDKGAQMQFPAVFEAIGKDCRRVQVDYWLPGRKDFYNPETRELHQTTNPVNADVEPKYHADIDGWLQCLASTEIQRKILLDWVATAMDLSKPTAALFLCGKKGTGKSLFGDCISSMWGQKGDYSKIVGATFQEAMLRTPVLVAEEGVKLKDSNAIQWFKELITTRYHTINTKNQALRYMSGCLRIIITANDVNGFTMPEGGAVDHVEAVHERLAFIQCGVEGRDYLKKVKHDDWAPGGQPGRFVEHMLWMREEHDRLTKPGRLLVRGDLDDAWARARRLSSSGLQADVLVALATWASRGDSNYIPYIAVSPTHPDVILVNSNALHQNWEDLTGDVRKPKKAVLPKALQSLSPWDEPARLRLPNGARPRCHAILSEDVMAVANASCIGDPDAMRRFLTPKELRQGLRTVGSEDIP